MGNILVTWSENQATLGARGALETPVPFGTGVGDSCCYAALCLANEVAEPAPGLYQHHGFVRVMESH